MRQTDAVRLDVVQLIRDAFHLPFLQAHLKQDAQSTWSQEKVVAFRFLDFSLAVPHGQLQAHLAHSYINNYNFQNCEVSKQLRAMAFSIL